MRLTFNTLLLLITIASSSFIGYSQTIKSIGELPVENFTSDITKTHNQYWSACEGPNGIMFFANTNGIVTYDGEEWNTIKKVDVRIIDKVNGKYYVGGTGIIGQLIVNEKNELEIEEYGSEYDFLNGVDIWEIFAINDSQIIFKADYSIFILNTNDTSIAEIKSETRLYQLEKFGDRLIGVTRDSGFYELKNMQFDFDCILGKDSSTIRHIRVIDYDDDHMLMYYRNGKTFLVNKRTLAKTPFEINFRDVIKNEFIYYYSTLNYKNKYFFYGTRKNGVFIFDKNGKLINHINQDDGLVSNYASSLFLNSNGQLWITHNEGVSRVNIFSPITYLDESQGLDKHISISTEIFNDHLYLLKRNGLYARKWTDYVNPISDDNNFKPVGNINQFGLDGYACYLATQNNNHLAIPTVNGTIIINKKDPFKIQRVQASESFNNSFFRKEKLHLTTDKKLFIYEENKKGLQLTDSTDLKKINGFGVYDKVNDKYWYSYNGTPASLNFINGSNEIENVDYDSTHNIKDEVRYSYVAKNSIGTYVSSINGIQFFDDQNEKFISHDYINKLLPKSNTVLDLKDGNNLLINGDIHFIKFNLNDSITYNTSLPTINGLKGVINIECKNQEDIFISKDKGLIHISDSLLKPITTKSTTIIREITTSKNDSIIHTGYSLKNNAISTDQDLTNRQDLLYRFNSIKFKYATTGFNGNKKNLYSVRLKGFEEEWSNWSNLNQKEYTNIPEGSFTFEVRSKNIFDQISNEATYTFTILPPWYRTWWAYTGYGILIIISVYGLIKWNTRRLEKEKEQLEQIVEERTEEIREQKAEIEQQAEEILAQNDQLTEMYDELEEKNTKITDSINYAKKIQAAMLTSQEFISDMFEENFLLYLPRDIVSGDFYWAYKTPSGKILWTAADCTGHGVPGAMMSMIGNSLLNEIVIEKGIEQPSLILDNLRDLLLKALDRGGSDNAKEGMDIALCSFDPKTMELEFAGAFNPLYIFREGELIETNGDLMPIGAYKIMNPFTNHKVQVQKGDVIYLFSDGYVDQMGGPKRKKFLPKRFRKKLTDIQELPLADQGASLKETYMKWKGDYMQMDDVVVFGVKI